MILCYLVEPYRPTKEIFQFLIPLSAKTELNKGIWGGAVYVNLQTDSSKTVSFNNAVFENNLASNAGEYAAGGVLSIQGDSSVSHSVSLTDTLFTGNKSVSWGGAIYLYAESISYKVLEVTDSLAEFAQSTGADFAGAFEFDVDMTEGDTEVLSFYVGDSTLTASDFSIFHKADGGQWEAGDVSNVSYDGAFLSFVVSHFSSYGYTAVPEPAEWAAIFGALALGFAIYRRRK